MNHEHIRPVRKIAPSNPHHLIVQVVVPAVHVSIPALCPWLRNEVHALGESYGLTSRVPPYIRHPLRSHTPPSGTLVPGSVLSQRMKRPELELSRLRAAVVIEEVTAAVVHDDHALGPLLRFPAFPGRVEGLRRYTGERTSPAVEPPRPLIHLGERRASVVMSVPLVPSREHHCRIRIERLKPPALDRCLPEVVVDDPLAHSLRMLQSRITDVLENAAGHMRHAEQLV